MQLAVIFMVANLLLLAWVPGHVPVPRYGKEITEDSQPEAGDGAEGEECSACRRMVVISNLVSDNLQRYMLETPSLPFRFIN